MKDPKLEQLVNWAYPFIVEKYKKNDLVPPKKSPEVIEFNLDALPDNLNKYRFYIHYKLSRGLYWQAADFFDEIPKEEREPYAKEMIEQAKVGGAHDWDSDYLWIVEKYYDGTLTEFIDDDLLNESVNKGFWEFVGRELTQKVMGALKDYKVLMSYKDRIKIDKVPIEKDIRATYLCSWDRDSHYGRIIDDLWWPDDDFVEIFNKFKNNLSKDDAAKLVRPIIEIEIKAALDDEFWGNRTKALEEGFKPYNEYLNHPRIQSLFEEYIRGYVSAMDSRFEYLLPYWNQSEENIKKFISNLVKDECSPDFIRKFPIKYLTDDLKSKIRTELEEYLKNPWDKSIVPNIYLWADAVYYGYIPEEDAKDFIEQKVKEYIGKKRISKKRLTELYYQLPDFVSTELKEEIRKRVEQKIEEYINKKQISRESLAELYYSELPDFVSTELREEIRKRAGIKESEQIKKKPKMKLKTLDDFSNI